MAYDDPIYLNNGVHDDPLCEALIRTVRGLDLSWYHVAARTGFNTMPFYRMEAGTAVLSSRVLSSAAYAVGWDNFIEQLRIVLLERPHLPSTLAVKPLRDAQGRKKQDVKEE